MNDNVNHPSHYTDGKIEVIDFIEDKKLNYHLGNAVKYISRAGKKDPDKYVEDLQKADWYIQREIGQKSEANVIRAVLEDLETLETYSPPLIEQIELGTVGPRTSAALGLQGILEKGLTPSGGSEFDIELKDGTKIVLQYGTDLKGNKFLVFKDPMWREQMNEDYRKPNYWRDAELRDKCNGEYFDLLPDWLQRHVLETTNAQVRDGERVETKDKLFPLSLSQVFPEDYLKWLGNGSTKYLDRDPEDTLISIFENPHNRVKFMWCEDRKLMDSVWWWLRSGGNTSDFYVVYTDGSNGGSSADYGYGVVLGFRIR